MLAWDKGVGRGWGKIPLNRTHFRLSPSLFGVWIQDGARLRPRSPNLRSGVPYIFCRCGKVGKKYKGRLIAGYRSPKYARTAGNVLCLTLRTSCKLQTRPLIKNGFKSSKLISAMPKWLNVQQQLLISYKWKNSRHLIIKLFSTTVHFK